MLVYVDDVIHLAKDAQGDVLKINQGYQFREGFGPSDRYIRSDINKVQL